MLKNFFAAMTVLLILSAQASAMTLTIGESVGSIGLDSAPFALKIDGGRQIDGDNSKGVVLFDENLYFHYNARLLEEKMPQAKNFDEEQKIFDEASRFGGSNFANAVPVFVFEGMTKIYPIDGDGYKFYLLVTETGGGNSLKVIGARGDKWVRYFDTLDMRRQIKPEYYLKDFYAAGDTIIFVYELWQSDKTCELRYKWDAAAQWFGVEVVYR